MGNLFRRYLLSSQGWLGLLLLWTAIDGGSAASMLISGGASAHPGLRMHLPTAAVCAYTISSAAGQLSAPAGGPGACSDVRMLAVRLQFSVLLPGQIRREITAVPAPVSQLPVLSLPDVALGAAGGVLLALLVAVLLAWGGRRAGSAERVRAVLNLEVVAQVPRFSRRARRLALPLAGAEHYRSLSVSFLGARPAVKLVTVSSAQAGEGKSTLVSDLAIHLARTGKRVLLIDLNIEHPNIARRFCLKSQAGLTDMLARYSTWLPLEQYCQVSAFPDLYVLAAGTCPLPALEFLRALTETQFFSHLQHTPFDYVLLDTPALCTGAEARTLAAAGQALMLVVHGSQTSRRQLASTRQLLGRMRLGGQVGILLNQGRASERLSLSAPGLAAGPRIEAVTLELPVVATRTAVLPETNDDHLPDTGKTVQIGRVSIEPIIRPPLSLSGLMGTTNGLLGRASATPVPSALQEPTGETRPGLS